MISLIFNLFKLMPLLFGIIFLSSSYADEPLVQPLYSDEPAFTGPIIASSGSTVPNGHTTFESSFLYINNAGFYSDTGKLVLTPNQQNTTIDPVFSHGISNTMDAQISLPYTIIHNLRFTYYHLSDIAMSLGYQVFKQKNAWFTPNLRLVMQEIIPSGKYDNLSSEGSGADGNGLGSYQTGISLNFQRLIPLTSIFTEYNYLMTHVDFSYFYASKVRIHGLSVYGGDLTTRGSFQPGQQLSVDVACEFSLLRQLSIVLEGFFWRRTTSSFVGALGYDNVEKNAKFAISSEKQATYAPAIEYNYNENFGIIAGYWFSTKGKNSPDFKSYVLALNFYF